MASASKQGHESLESYVDNLRVKISEHYKPPPRINVAMTYAQRLTLNKHIQDNMPNYEFVLENAVLERMKEWKSVRKSTFEERKTKVEQLKNELKEKQIESVENVEVKTVDQTAAVPNINNYNSNDTNIVFASSSINNQNFTNYTTSNNILIPMQISTNYSNILTPIPLTKAVNQQYNCKPVDKSPFNLSDFENDTSSPFDNMELKSINDMEELAQVLKREEGKYNTNMNTPMYQQYQVTPQVASQSASVGQMQQNIPNYLGYTYSIPDTVSYAQPVISDYSQTNGYYYSPDILRQNESYNSSYLYSKPSNAGYNQVLQTASLESKKSNCKSVPDIIKSLEVELENSHLDNMLPNTSDIRGYVSPQTSRPKSTEAVMYPRVKDKDDDLDNPFNALPKAQQDLCRSISSMGFPLSRVARSCKILGSDHKKIVEHLLALSDLLDLGFSEKAVSEALLQCGNDRDKALDKLIS
ncbi:ubiquitin-associated protein 1 [Anoplophora glabripennis]|nr:ubiquitin-associated protein 1 [Anoplophora glabripennis]